MESHYSKEAAGRGNEQGMDTFYTKQAGGAIDPYVSYRTLQRGNGFFGRLITGSMLPLIKQVLPYLTGKAVEGVEGLVQDHREGKTLKESAKKRLKNASASILADAAAKIQSGAGKRHKRKRSLRKTCVAKKQKRCVKKQKKCVKRQKKCVKKCGKKKLLFQ